MIVTLAIVSAHLFVAALGRRREVGFGKAFLYSVLLTPFLSLPIVLKSKKLPAKPKASGSKPSEVKPPAGSEKNPSEIFVANLKSGKSAAFDVTDVLPCEMEDFALWGDRIVCPTNASKGYSPVFAFRLKDLVL